VEASPQNTNNVTATATIASTTITAGSSGTGILVSGALASAMVTDSSVTGNATGIDVEGGSLTARNNFITGNTGPAVLVGSVGTPSVTVQDNDLSNNGSTVVQNNSGSTVDAAEDYWGSAYTTPAAVVALVSGPVNFEPILTTGDADSSTPGFQPDTTKLAVDVSAWTTNPTEPATYTLNLAPSNPTANNATITQWVINWGDNQTTTLSLPSIPTSVAHTYAEEGNYTITAVATDELGNTVTTSVGPFSVADASLTDTSTAPATQPSVSEGASTGTLTVATFTDANPGDNSADFTATIHWGDGKTDTGVPVTYSNGTYSVSGSHVYDEAGTAYAVTVDVADTGGQSLTGIGQTTVTVSDASLTDTSAAPDTQPSVTEGAGTGTLTVATFTDANPGDNSADFTATIHWGDGQDSAGTVSYANGVYSVSGSHTYTDENSSGYAVTVDVIDGGGSSLTAIGKTTVTVNDAGLTDTSGGNAVATGGVEGGAAATLSGVTFTDANPGNNSDDFTATINWGDNGPTSQGTVSYDNSTYTVAGTHQYAEGGYYTISILVADDGGQTITIGASTTVADAPLTASAVTFGGTEGAAVSNLLVATFTDADPNGTASDYTATINWGDGDTTASYTIVPDGTVTGQFDVIASKSNPYAEAGIQEVTVVVTDHNASATANSSAVINDAPLQGSGVPSLVAKEGASTNLVVATFTDANPNPNANDFSATIDWGDGSPATSGVITQNKDGSFSVSGTHAYLTPTGRSMDAITVDVSDVGGAATGITSYISVTNVSPTPRISGPNSGVSGQTLSYTGSFTDPGQDGNETYTFLWTAKNSSGTVIQSGTDQNFNFALPTSVQGTGIYTVSFTVKDSFGGSGTVSQLVMDPAAMQSASVGGVVNAVSTASLATPVLSAATVGSSRNANLVITLSDPLATPHFGFILWGDRTVQVVWLGSGTSGSFSVKHRYSKHARHVTITVVAFDPQTQAFSNIVTLPYTIRHA
jgi:hypothetical protein